MAITMLNEKFKEGCAFTAYVAIVLYLLNPLFLLVIIGLILSPMPTIPGISLLAVAFLVTIIYYKFWLLLRGCFMRYESIYFRLFEPGKFERRKCSRDTTDSKSSTDT